MESSAHETQTLRPTKVYTVWTVNDDLCHRYFALQIMSIPFCRTDVLETLVSH